MCNPPQIWKAWKIDLGLSVKLIHLNIILKKKKCFIIVQLFFSNTTSWFQFCFNLYSFIFCSRCICIVFTICTFQMVLVSPTGEQYDALQRHLRARLDEGCGETIFVVGMGSSKNVVQDQMWLDCWFLFFIFSCGGLQMAATMAWATETWKRQWPRCNHCASRWRPTSSRWGSAQRWAARSATTSSAAAWVSRTSWKSGGL